MPYDRTEPGLGERAVSDAKPVCTALVPVVVRTERRARRRWYRWAPDPTFVTHLIAEAEQVPQARRVRRASMADAQAAYRPRPAVTQGTGGLMRQVI
jgi:hypothetical protein